MRPSALLLRILLAVALVVNAIGGAVAGVAGSEAIGHVAAASVEVATAASHCGGSPADHPVVPERPAPADGHPCPSSGEDDCSDDARCLQACTHACAALARCFAIGVQVNAGSPLHPFTRGLPSAPVRSAIRPPIA